MNGEPEYDYFRRVECEGDQMRISWAQRPVGMSTPLVWHSRERRIKRELTDHEVEEWFAAAQSLLGEEGA